MLWMCCKGGWGRVSTCVVIEWGARAAGVVLVPGVLLLAEDSCGSYSWVQMGVGHGPARL